MVLLLGVPKGLVLREMLVEVLLMTVSDTDRVGMRCKI